jgi:hypothetical protein
MSDSYISKLDSLLTMLKSIIQTVPEAQKLLDSVGVDIKDLEPTVKDSKTGAVLGQKTERQAQIRVEDVEEAIASNERLNQLVKERIALLQQEANAQKQVSAAAPATAKTNTPASTGKSSTRTSRTGGSSAKSENVPGEYGIAVPVYTAAGSSASPNRIDVLGKDEDVASLSRSELAQMKLTVRAVAKKLTAAGSSRGAGLLKSIRPESTNASIANAFEEALTSLVMKGDGGFQPIGTVLSARMKTADSFKKTVGTARQMVRQAIAKPTVSKEELAAYDETYGTSVGRVRSASTKDGDSDSGNETYQINSENRATGRAKRRSLHNSFGVVRDSIKHRLGIRVGKGTNDALRQSEDRSRGYVESAKTSQMLSDGVDKDIMQAMAATVQGAIEDLRAGRVVEPTSGQPFAGPGYLSKLPKSIVASLVKFAPLVQGASRETTARGAIGRENGSLGVFGGPTAQNAFSGIFSSFLAQRMQESGSTSVDDQIKMLQNLNISEIFENLFAPSGIDRTEKTTTIAGIMHQRVKDELEKRVKIAEEAYVVAGKDDEKQAKYNLKAAQDEYDAYMALDRKPTTVTVNPTKAKGSIKVSTGGSYASRTERNAAAAPVTLSYAADHETAGERKTAASVKKAGGTLVKDEGQSNEEIAKRLISSLQATGATSLNVSGNAISDWKKAGVSQEQVNRNVYDILKIVKENYPLLDTVVSGGQTGTDIAGSVAAAALGLNADVHMPNDYLQRAENGRDVKRTQQDIENYIKEQALALNPTAFGTARKTDAILPMKYSMHQSQLREDLKPKYLAGTTTAQLVRQGIRTATTRSAGNYKVGQVIEIPEAPGMRYEISSIDKPDFSTPEGIAAWEAKEGWSFKDLPESIKKQVTGKNARQISFKPYEEPKSGSTEPFTHVIPANIPVPADMIANPTALQVGVENDPEEMIKRVAGGRFENDFKFADMVTNIRPIASRALQYLRSLGRSDLPVPFDAPTPLQVIAQNNKEGFPLTEGLQSQLKQAEELSTRKNKFTDNLLASFGLIGSNSGYQNFSQGLQVASEITDSSGKVVPARARGLGNPLSSLKNFFSSMQQLEQAQYSGFPIVDFANAFDPEAPNEELQKQMLEASPVLEKLIGTGVLEKIRNLSKTKKYTNASSFKQFSMLSGLLKPFLAPALAANSDQGITMDTLTSAPELLEKSLPILHTPGDMSDRLAVVLGKTDQLNAARQESSTYNTSSMAGRLRFRISELARSVLGRMPSPAYNDEVVQRHKREGIVSVSPREDLAVSDALAAKQVEDQLMTADERPGEFVYSNEYFEAGDNIKLEDAEAEQNRLLSTPLVDLTNNEQVKRAQIEEMLTAGVDPLA